MDYQFWLVRYVPDSARGEFVNIGLVVGGNHQDWAFRRVDRLTRAKHLGGNLDAAGDALKSFELKLGEADFRLFGGDALPSVGWIEDMRKRMSNTVQLSRPRPARGDSAAALADLLFATLVVDPPARDASTERARLSSSLEIAYKQVASLTSKNLRRRVAVQSGLQKTALDFAVNKHDDIVQITQLWSFRRKSLEPLEKEILAATFGFEQLRRRGGDLVNPRTGERIARLSADVPVRVLYVPPANSAQRDVLAKAEDAWSQANIRSYSEGNEADLARELVA